MSKVKKSLTKIKNLAKDNWKYLATIGGMTLLSLFMVVSKFRELNISVHSKEALLVIGGLLLVTILMSLILYRAKIKKWKIEKIYLVLAIILGCFYMLIIPVGMVSDEAGHFMRAYEISEGRLIPENGGITVPKNLQNLFHDIKINNAYTDIKENISVKADTEHKNFENTISGYAPINYIPQVIGIWIGKILHLPLIPMMYLARLLNMIFCVVIVYFCIKYIPVMKKLVFLMAMFPMTMQLFASVAADGSIICAGIALITYVLYTRKVMKRKLNIKDFLLLFIICTMLTMTKPLYALMCPIVFWIPKERFKSIKHKIWFIMLLGGATLALVLLKMVLGPLAVDKYGARDTQINTILHQPLAFLGPLFRTAIMSPEFFITSTIGKQLEWFNIDLTAPYIITIFIFFVLMCRERETTMPGSLRAFALGAFGLIVVLAFASEFVVWTQPGTQYIDGTQGRYFLPALLLIPIILMPSKQNKNRSQKLELIKPKYLYVVMTLVNVFAVMVVMASHI